MSANMCHVPFPSPFRLLYLTFKEMKKARVSQVLNFEFSYFLSDCPDAFMVCEQSILPNTTLALALRRMRLGVSSCPAVYLVGLGRSHSICGPKASMQSFIDSITQRYVTHRPGNPGGGNPRPPGGGWKPGGG